MYGGYGVQVGESDMMMLASILDLNDLMWIETQIYLFQGVQDLDKPSDMHHTLVLDHSRSDVHDIYGTRHQTHHI